MVIASVLAAACVAMGAPEASTPRTELETAAAGYSKLMDFDLPKDVEPRVLEYRKAQILALGTFLQKNTAVIATGAVHQTEVEGFLLNWIQVNRDITQCFQALKFPSGLIKTYRIQSEHLQAMRRFVRSRDDYGEKCDKLLKQLDAEQELMDSTYQWYVAKK